MQMEQITWLEVRPPPGRAPQEPVQLRLGCFIRQSKRGVLLPSASRVVHAFVKMLGVKLNQFKMVDPNTFYLVNGVRRRTSAVQHNPDVLQYGVWRSERGRSAEELKEQALQAVINQAGKSQAPTAAQP